MLAEDRVTLIWSWVRDRKLCDGMVYALPRGMKIARFSLMLSSYFRVSSFFLMLRFKL